MDDRQPAAVVAAGERAELMLDLVCFKVGLFAELEDAVFRHRRRPHQVAARVVICRIDDRRVHVADYAAHQRFRDIIRHVFLVRFAEIDFHDMR